MLTRSALLAALTLASLTPASSRAQTSNGEVGPDSSSLRIRAARRDTIRATATVTAAFTVSNAASDSVSVMPHVEMPKDWTILMGGNALPVAGRSTEMLMLGLVVPSRAAAGIYPVRVWITTSRDTRGVMDSVVVRVPERRAVEINMLDRPGFVVSGRNYRTTFQLRNRGNFAADLRLAARASVSVVALSDTTFTLAPEEVRVITATARTRTGLQSAVDDVLELSARQRGDTAEPTESSVRVTVVPEPTRKIEEFLRLPVVANLRASNGGVAPFEITGAGYVLDGSGIRAELLLRGKPTEFAAFGERDEYRVQFFAPHWQARLGDNFYMLSPLTGGSQPGIGASIAGDRGRFSAGGYSQQFRRAPEGGTETGAFVGAQLMDGARLTLNMVTRAGGLMPANVGSATAAFSRDIYHGDVELAGSSASGGNGLARTARFGASAPRFSVDFGHSYADTTFSGAQRGAHHNFVTGNVAAFEHVSFGVNASRHESDLSRATGVPYVENLDVAILSATLFDAVTLELNGLTRGATISGVTASGTQRGVRARGDLDTPVASLSLEAEGGRSTDATLVKRTYTDVTVNARRGFGRGSVAMWTSRYSGGGLTKGEFGALTFGGDASLRASASTNVSLMGYATRPDVVGQSWHSQLDVLAMRTLRNGSSLTLRARMMGGGNARADRTVAFLEYGMPLRLPVSRLRTRGRVQGRVVDAVTGSGVPGALVRLGPQVAITDNDGDVAFGGVPAGEHRLSMSQETSFADAVFVGDPTLNVDSNRTSPTPFRLAIARSARVNLSVRRFAVRQTAITPVRDTARGATTPAAPRDSLVDAGPLPNATLVLTGERDTLYRTTGENGTATFTDVPPGTWILTLRGDAPAYHRFDPDRLELVLKPGETQEFTFRLIPRRREIQIIGEGQELKSTTADSKTQTPASGVRTVKPDEKKHQ